jgi:hypothetical protein
VFHTGDDGWLHPLFCCAHPHRCENACIASQADKIVLSTETVGKPIFTDCTARGHKGATLQHPGWKNGHVEREPFPVDEASSGHQELLFD